LLRVARPISFLSLASLIERERESLCSDACEQQKDVVGEEDDEEVDVFEQEEKVERR
jgi:hypothetical protein